MVVRAWLVVGILVIGVAWYFTVVAPLPTSQVAAQTPIDRYRQAGLMPAAEAWKLSTEIGHDVFELPATDAEHLAEELAAQMTAMPGMTMGAAEPSGDAGDAMEGMAMDQPDEPQVMQMADEAATTDAAAPMQMEAGSAEATDDQAMPGMVMETAKDAAGASDSPATGQVMQMAEGVAGDSTSGQMEAAEADAAPAMAMDQPGEQPAAQMPGMDMADTAAGGDHAEAAEAAEGGHEGGGGIELVAAGAAMPAARTIEVKMTEWGYSPSSIMVEPGEVIRFVITNGGNIPHEFMLMTGPGMASVGYRIQRADWNLTEHEAIFENPLVMPGDSFETVLKIEQPGLWMFMCMFPFHMQLGMMGVMMTEGMEMGDMQM